MVNIKECPKCAGVNIHLVSNICETSLNGLGIRYRCKDCGFAPPKSEWQWYSSEKALDIWNNYKRD